MIMNSEQNKIKLQNLLTRNQIILKNLWDLDQDLGILLDKQSTLFYHNCDDLRINVASKINRIIFNKCEDINIKLCGLVSGLELKNCSNINIYVKKNFLINSLSFGSVSMIL